MADDPCPPRPGPKRARAALAFGAALFAAGQLGLTATVELAVPGVRDPEYGAKLGRLRRCLDAAPGRPLVLFMGTSRTFNGLDPAELAPVTAGPAPVAFNFAQTGAGPLFQLVLLRRLLARGIRPAHVFLEVLPPHLLFEGEAALLLDHRRVGWGDWPVLARYWPAGRSRAGWWAGGLVPAWSDKEQFLALAAPRLEPSGAAALRAYFARVGADGFLAFAHRSVTAREYARGLALAHQEYAWLMGRAHLSRDALRALREFLELCRARGIGVTLVLMPEASAFRGWWSPGAWRQARDCLEGLCRDYGLALVDAGRWADDADFADGHHLLPVAATAFSRRFGREVYGPFLRREIARGPGL